MTRKADTRTFAEALRSVDARTARWPVTPPRGCEWCDDVGMFPILTRVAGAPVVRYGAVGNLLAPILNGSQPGAPNAAWSWA